MVWVNLLTDGNVSETGLSSPSFETCAVSTAAALDSDSDTEVTFSTAIVIVSGGE
jgi:hypothetical protein